VLLARIWSREHDPDPSMVRAKAPYTGGLDTARRRQSAIGGAGGRDDLAHTSEIVLWVKGASTRFPPVTRAS
jgi:hypothetical protein